ncbi:cation transporter [uncultured Nisaea sp.]|jgi:Co/Zn/Cd efflux system component|uniref:cation transporter n=1 Tax=uncultured Nisaea sp. TaxID=538215 RepID=UPI0030EE441E|tara:strand:+ start:6227 stop:6856 length:630 start_codon:yes stop_codon:yes gene_type:complete
MAGCCGHDHENVVFEGMSAAYRRALWAVILINGVMFVVEMAAGFGAGSMALKADALDFLADTATYALSFYVIGKAANVRAGAALFKGISLALMGIWVFGSTAYQVLVVGVPEAAVMSVVGVLAFVANMASVGLLYRFRDGDANVRSVWLCSRNDAIGNVAVVLAAAGVWQSGTGWPDLAVAGVMASLFCWSSFQIIRQGVGEMRAVSAT